MGSNLEQLPERFAIRLPEDADQLTGRECPECERYFRIQFGTGLKGEGLPCHCPYCGHTGDQNQFFTQDQLEYAESVVVNRVTEALLKDLKQMEFEMRPSGPFGIGISMKVKGQPTPIRRYIEEDLETEIICDNCTLRYAVYGVFAFCPDCGRHNSLQILDKNLDVVEKKLDLAGREDESIAGELVRDALGNVVAAFDAFGRETCRVWADRAAAPDQARKLSFQSLENARKRLQTLFGFDLAEGIAPDGWRLATIAFQARHLIAHRAGVVDEEYLQATGDASAVLGRKIVVTADEVRALATVIRSLGANLMAELGRGPAYVECPPDVASLSLSPEPPRGPLPASGLSSEAQRLAALVNARSKNGRVLDPCLSLAELQQTLEMSLDDLEMAIDELSERAWITTHPDANSPIGIHAISATMELFCATDKTLRGWDTRMDARLVAEAAVKTGERRVDPQNLATVLGWEPRRLNPAMWWLGAHGMLHGLQAFHRSYLFVSLHVTARTRRFVRSNRTDG